MLANLSSPSVMMIGLGAVIAMVVLLLLDPELSNFLDVQKNKKIMCASKSASRILAKIPAISFPLSQYGQE